ncbi:uncharacterized protein [Amphiura filiformis]|uniref:uncharacterized protein n=1 Tax=Amphiura filiformis TaxID=82378 RepID=UPI003B214CFA
MGDTDCYTLVVRVIMFASIIGFPVASIYLGVEYKDDCPVESMIPVFLIVLGATSLLILVVSIMLIVSKSCESDCCKCCLGLLYFSLLLLFVAWIGVGTYWYTSAFPDRNGDPFSDNFCQYTLYAYFCSQVILSYLLLLLIFVGCCLICCADNDDQDDEVSSPGGYDDSGAVSTIHRRTQMAYYMVERIRVVQLQTVHT